MRRALLLSVGVLLLAFAAPAGAETMNATSGPVTAALTFTPVPDELRWKDMRLTVVRNGVAVVDRRAGAQGCGVPYCRPVEMLVRDLDGDAEPEVLVTYFTNGAHCCTVTQLLS